MPDILTTKPGDKYASIRNPRMYRALRRRGYSKESAAKITNARSKSVDDLERAVEQGQPQYLIDAIAAQCVELPRLKGEQIAPGITRIRGNLCNVHGRYGRCPGAAVAAPKPATAKPKKGRGRKPVKPKKTDAERQAEQDAKRQQNQDAVADALAQADASLGPTGVKAVLAAAAGGTLDATTGADLEKLGYAQKNPDGSYRLTPEARALASAANRGDTRAALDADGRAQERAKKRSTAAASKPEKEPKAPKGGGGGGKGPKEKPTDDEKRQQQTQERQQRASETAAKVGLGADDADALRTAAETGGVDNAALRQLGFIDADGMATDQGRRALAALERGDVRAYNAAVQDARARMAREQATASRRAETEQRRTEAERTRQQRQAETERRRAETERRQAQRDAERAKRDEEKRTEPERKRAARRARREAARNETRMQKAFHVYKQANGVYRWVAFSSNAYRDRDCEIVSTKALADDCARADQDGMYGPLRWWHVPGVELGTCDFNAMHGRILVESGTFKSSTIGARIAAKADQLQLSIGFVHPPDEPDAHGVFHHIRRFERSLVPRGRAANPWTILAVTKESVMFDNVKRAALKALGFSDDEIGALSTQAQATQKDADESGATFKAEEAAPAPPDEVTIGGVVYTLKAPPPPVAEEQPADLEIEEKIDGEELMVEEEPTGGLTLSPEDLTAITEAIAPAIQAALAPVVGMLDIEKKVAGHVQNMLAPYQTQKDAADAERAQQIADLQTTLKATQDKLAELLGETPRAYHRITDNPVVSETRKEQLVPPTQTDFDPIVTQLMGNGVHLPGN